MLIVQRATLRPNRVGMGLLSSVDLVVGKVLASKQNQSIFEGELRGEKCCVKQVPLVDSALAWNEAEMLAKLGPSELFPRFFGVAQDKNNLQVVTELLHPMGAEERGSRATEHLFQLASAIGLMHSKQICHRDIKLANVMIGSSFNNAPTAKLMDFDRSCEFYELEHLEPVGTLTHMAPELLCWELPCTEKIDSYAFGITMFEMMHPGVKPYPGYTTPGLPGSLTKEEVVKKIVDDKWRPNWTHDNVALKQLAERCWSDSPHDRPDFVEIVHELSVALNFPKPLPSPPVTIPLPTPHTMQTVGSHTSIGHVRTTMEDASCILVAPEFTLLGAFDGLRSHHTSSFASRLFPLLYRDSLKLAFTETNELLKQMHFTCGSTATVVVVSATTIKAGWLGDSSAYLFTKTKLTPVRYQVKDLIVKHSPEREDEKFRIEQCGGQVKRDQAVMDDGSRMSVGPWRAVADSSSHAMGIAISRALGLFKFQPVISPQPEFITVQRRPEDRFLVVATDGLWDLVGLNEVLQKLRDSNGDAELASKSLVALAMDRGAHDNVSVVVAMM
ncbi:hypothetical protein BASA81_006418 [Batrachochytrium salamandrivorans]|nr:hypothetical protein BASA81_006418 [Batrachochytrium salamandrivorans]